MRLMTRQDVLRRYTCARVVVGNGRSAAIKTFQRVIDLPYVVIDLLMRADVPQENLRAAACEAFSKVSARKFTSNAVSFGELSDSDEVHFWTELLKISAFAL